MQDLLADLKWRGLVHQSTHPEVLEEHLRTPRRVYAGFDPSADSLTIGNLVPIVTLRRFQLAGHTPVVVMGGATGLIGDPSGKEAERQLLAEEEVTRNVQSQRGIFDRLLDTRGENAVVITNNLDWVKKLSFLDVLRGPGKHFSVNQMIQKESVSSRLEQREHGISYTEFSYMVIQAYDYAWLAEHQDVSVQLGGSDQWGNIVLGVDLVRRTSQKAVFGLTVPLITKADGGKFGKTEAGAVWLSAARTSPYAFYQFWINTSDADLEKYFKVFSLLPRQEIEDLLARHAEAPEKRHGQERLASQMTELLHGDEGRDHALLASRALFGGQVKGLPKALLEEVFAHAPSSQHDPTDLNQAGKGVIDLLVEAQVAKSKRDARQLVDAGAISVNGHKADMEYRLTPDSLLHNEIALIRKGKKHWHVARWRPVA